MLKGAEVFVTEMFSLIVYMLICSFTPGPGNILALNTTGTYGWKRSRRLILGICLGYAVVQTICSIIIYQMNHMFSATMEILRIVGGCYMICLAIHIIRSRPDECSINKNPSLLEGLLLQLVNVKIYFYITTLLSVYFIPNSRTIFELVMSGAFAVCVEITACLTWAFLGSKIQDFYIKHVKLINIILGLFLIYCAWTMLKG